MLNLRSIRAISLDLDDTLWPIWPTIERAEKVLHEWLVLNAPMTAERYSTPQALREIRNAMQTAVALAVACQLLFVSRPMTLMVLVPLARPLRLMAVPTGVSLV